MTWMFIVVAVVAIIGIYLSWTAGRLDRLHARVDGSRASLEAQLFRRSGVAIEVATSGLLDPATAILVADAANRARSAPDDEREVAESDLSKALSAVFAEPEVVSEIAAEPGANQLLTELGAACRRVEMARRFHNDTVASTRVLRSKRLVRWFRLAGYAKLPDMVELDDTQPAGLPL